MSDEKVSLHLEPIEKSEVSGGHKEGGMYSGENFGREAITLPESGLEQSSEKNEKSEHIYQKILTATSQKSSVSGNDDESKDAEMVAAATDAESQVKQLVDLAVIKGVVHAVKVAKKLNDFYVLDQMHDDLANRLYESLKEKGLIDDSF